MKKVFLLAATMIALSCVFGASAWSDIILYNRSAHAGLPVGDLGGSSFGIVYVRPVGSWSDFLGEDAAGRMKLTFAFDRGATEYVGAGRVYLNPDSENYFDYVFEICNLGKDNVDIILSSDTPRVKFYMGAEAHCYARQEYNTHSYLGHKMKPGDCIRMGVYVDARGKFKGDTIDATITIKAQDLQ